MAQKRRRNKRWVYWVMFLVLLVAAGVVAYLVWDNYFNDKKVESGQQNVEQIDERGDEKEQASDIAEGGVEEKKKVEQYEGDDPNKAEDLTGVVTYAGVNGGNLVIRVNIDQYLNGGECDLELAKDGMSMYADMASIVSSASTSTCEGFNVPVTSVGSGKYDVIIKLSSGGKNGVIRKEVEI